MLKQLTAILSDFFEVGSDCYHYILERVKYAELTAKDFREYNEDDVAEIAEHLIANGVTVQRWIPVTERLPKAEDANRFGEIMVWLRSTETQALWRWRRAIDHPEAITHWMPLPEPPKEVE